LSKSVFQKHNWSEFVVRQAEYKRWAITLGNFDGFHLGHLSLIKNLKEIAEKEKLNSGVITFFSHPQKLLKKKQNYEIFDFEHKKKIFCQQQIHSIFYLHFDEALSNTSATSFLAALCKKIPICYFCVGYDFSFGKNREGNIELLKKIALQKNFQVIQFAPLRKRKIISSSLIRKLLLQGNFNNANNYLGRQWSLEGVVSEGKKLGRKLGFPTINLELNFQPPLQNAVYIVEVILQGKKYKAVANYGVAPSVQSLEKSRLECHLLDFCQDIYGEKVEVIFHKLLRLEKKFANLNLLKKQILLDIKGVRAFFEKNTKNIN
jgi:riboflavin kinase/FMN adenylyltransferase